jgi:nitronate monooxygenase
MNTALTRAEQFCRRFGLRAPILLAPMAGACPPELSIAVANAGGLGACGVLLMPAADIADWVARFRAGSQGAFQLNMWIPDPVPARDAAHETRLRGFLGQWGPEVPASAGDARPPELATQCAAMLEARPPVVSSIMGVYPPDFVRELKARGIAWFAVATTVAEAREAEAAGADAIIAQGMEAGGHRGCFDADAALTRQVGLFALLPAVADAVRIPVIAAGGIADARGVAAALTLGASATLVGSGFLRSNESSIPAAGADAMAHTAPEDTMVSRVFSGRAGRCIVTDYVRAASADDAPPPAPYPVQRGLTSAMRKEAKQKNDMSRMQAWAGQSSAMAQARPAGEILHALWDGAQTLLG